MDTFVGESGSQGEFIEEEEEEEEEEENERMSDDETKKEITAKGLEILSKANATRVTVTLYNVNEDGLVTILKLTKGYFSCFGRVKIRAIFEYAFQGRMFDIDGYICYLNEFRIPLGGNKDRMTKVATELKKRVSFHPVEKIETPYRFESTQNDSLHDELKKFVTPESSALSFCQQQQQLKYREILKCVGSRIAPNIKIHPDYDLFSDHMALVKCHIRIAGSLRSLVIDDGLSNNEVCHDDENVAADLNDSKFTDNAKAANLSDEELHAAWRSKKVLLDNLHPNIRRRIFNYNRTLSEESRGRSERISEDQNNARNQKRNRKKTIGVKYFSFHCQTNALRRELFVEVEDEVDGVLTKLEVVLMFPVLPGPAVEFIRELIDTFGYSKERVISIWESLVSYLKGIIQNINESFSNWIKEKINFYSWKFIETVIRAVFLYDEHFSTGAKILNWNEADSLPLHTLSLSKKVTVSRTPSVLAISTPDFVVDDFGATISGYYNLEKLKSRGNHQQYPFTENRENRLLCCVLFGVSLMIIFNPFTTTYLRCI